MFSVLKPNYCLSFPVPFQMSAVWRLGMVGILFLFSSARQLASELPTAVCPRIPWVRLAQGCDVQKVTVEAAVWLGLTTSVY